MPLLFRVESLRKRIFTKSIFFISFPLIFFPSSSLIWGAPSLMTDQDPALRLKALETIKPEKVLDRKTIESLIETLHDPSSYIQSEAMYLLEQIGKPAVPYLMESLKKDGISNEWRILYLLARQNIKNIIPELKKIIEISVQKNDFTPLCTSLYSLGFVGGSDEAAFILNLLPSSNTAMEKICPIALYNIARRDLYAFFRGIYSVDPYFVKSGEILKKVISNLAITPKTILSLWNKPVFQAAALFILRHWGSGDISPFFEEGLNRKNPEIQFQAIQAIIDHKLKHLASKLLPLIKNPIQEKVRLLAIDAIRDHLQALAPPQKKDLRQHLLKLLDHDSLELRNKARQTLAYM